MALMFEELRIHWQNHFCGFLFAASYVWDHQIHLLFNMKEKITFILGKVHMK